MRNPARAYDVVARRYEERFAGELDHKPRDRELLDELVSSSGGPVLDIGCGPGQIGAYVAAGGRSVFGVDLSAQMAASAATRLAGAAVGDLRRLPFASETAGAIAAFYCVIHLDRDELGAAFEEFGRVLVRGGRVLVTAHEGTGEVGVTAFLDHEVDLQATFFVLDELVAAIEGAGLSVVSAERRAPYDNEGDTVRLYVLAERSSGPA